MNFPDGFAWGAATASYQIEGSPLADGAGPSIWHRFSHTPGNIRDGDTGDIACDHYHRWSDDIALMSEIGLKAYRFSISWSRIFPEGTGAVNAAGLDFYDRLVDGLCDAGIDPFATIYHWDLPAALQDRGGWANRDCASWYADYASVLFDRLGDRVKHWITLNEPHASAGLSYMMGLHAPGIRDVWAGLRAVHHLMLGHGRAVSALRASRNDGEIGITVVTSHIRPATQDPADVAAAERSHAYLNRLYLEPILQGRYPDVLVDWWDGRWPQVTDADLAEISAPVDFLGLNYYFPGWIVSAPGTGILGSKPAERDVPRTAMGWEIDPAGLRWVLNWVRSTFGNPPVYITENGACFDNDSVSDDNRVAYLEGHFREAGNAIADGCDLRGYFVWSLMDNFEWTHGYSKRFGIVRVDYETQAREIKRSGRWYADVIARNGLDP